MKDKRQPWMKFFPSDWRSEATLDTCSLAARGLWMEMLCIMSEAEPRGFLVRNGRQYTPENLAAVSRSSVKEVTRLLQELEHEGVFSRATDGAIYSRRMRRDVEKAIRDKANGQTGGNPNLNESDKQEVNAGVNPPDKAHIPEAKSQSPEVSLRETRRQAALGMFEEIWKLYPRRDGHNPKKPAREKLVRIAEGGEPLDQVRSGVIAYEISRRGQDPRYTKQLVVFLNQEGWRDEHRPTQPRAGPSRVVDGVTSILSKFDEARRRDRADPTETDPSLRPAGAADPGFRDDVSPPDERGRERWTGPQLDLVANSPDRR